MNGTIGRCQHSENQRFSGIFALAKTLRSGFDSQSSHSYSILMRRLHKFIKGKKGVRRMAENDIYNNKGRYDKLKNNLPKLLIKPKENNINHKGKKQYYCKSSDNLEHFKQLMRKFEANDTSYIRRLRVLSTLKLIVYATDKELSKCNREDIDSITAFMHTRYKSSKSKGDFIKDTKFLWKTLFPESDERGRPDETIVPYMVRHLNSKIDVSKEKRRNDKLTLKEFEEIVIYFSKDVRIQAYLMLALESLARPQELLFTKLSDYEFYDNYAKVYLSSHTKEGLGLLQCIDSFPYVLKWYDKHPYKNNKDAFFFVNIGDKNTLKQLKPSNINKKLRKACKDLNIDKQITCYSIKRNAITFRRLRGDSDLEIQHAARWTSSKQLKTYDMSNQEDAFKIELVKRGLVKDTEKRFKRYLPETKLCIFCNSQVGFTEEICPKCKHIIDRDKVKEQIEDNSRLNKKVDNLQNQLDELISVFDWVREIKGKELLVSLSKGV